MQVIAVFFFLFVRQVLFVNYRETIYAYSETVSKMAGKV